ncbi:MAG: hypothetical protein LBD24_09640 [Spirochaetaceae bacterium]|nr:hypothetical protein [Spirochaetaceae bacterium]
MRREKREGASREVFVLPAPAAYETAGGCRAQKRTASEPSEAARSVAAPGPCKTAHRTRCCTVWKQQAAMFETAGGWAEAEWKKRAGTDNNEKYEKHTERNAE